ncbi:GNAT family N-acetyltransferase [Algibacter sp. 2305UL17-15]|uniref:GNAT family N-acetyltransferase n=1 Tax=Algibacter sp. 2305UL17-15 TaxID=3231268 RepID=UPI0034592EA6
MIIKTFDAFSRLSIFNINRITNFLHDYSGVYKDSKSAIRKSLMYAAKEVPGLGGYVFVAEKKDEIIGVLVINRTGMNEYIAENILVNIAVKTEYRGAGVANALINYVKEYCDGDIALHIHKENPAVALFKNQGFKTKYIEMRLER